MDALVQIGADRSRNWARRLSRSQISQCTSATYEQLSEGAACFSDTDLHRSDERHHTPRSSLLLSASARARTANSEILTAVHRLAVSQSDHRSFRCVAGLLRFCVCCRSPPILHCAVSPLRSRFACGSRSSHPTSIPVCRVLRETVSEGTPATSVPGPRSSGCAGQVYGTTRAGIRCVAGLLRAATRLAPCPSSQSSGARGIF
jgi:hypothetical protein